MDRDGDSPKEESDKENGAKEVVSKLIEITVCTCDEVTENDSDCLIEKEMKQSTDDDNNGDSVQINTQENSEEPSIATCSGVNNVLNTSDDCIIVADACEDEFYSRETVRRLTSHLNNEDYQRYVEKAEDDEENKLLRIVVNPDIKNLENTCINLGIKGDFTVRRNQLLRIRDTSKPKRSLPEDNLVNSKKRKEYEVEEIVDYDVAQNLYLVKWVGWYHESNTWEPESHLRGTCDEILNDFKLAMTNKSDTYNTEWDSKLTRLHLTLCNIKKFDYNDPVVLYKLSDLEIGTKPASTKTWAPTKNLVACCYNMLGDEMATPEFKNYVFGSKRLITMICEKMKLDSRFGGIDNFLQFVDKRKTLSETLKRWESEMNAVINGDPTFEPNTTRGNVFVENEVDLEGPPENFIYINRSIFRGVENEHLLTTPVAWCQCTNCYENKKTCCPNLLDSTFMYTKEGVLREGRGGHIVECNDKCPCDQNCPNRVIQKGTQVNLIIYRTNNNRGWGVKAKDRILKGRFVMEYVGEIIPLNVADERGRKYGAEGRTYLFDLDFDDNLECQYSVDATRFGNVSHFVNHSCDPNLEVYCAWINHLDRHLPRLVFFSRRQILKGEELTFDYRMTRPTPNESEVKQIDCKCGSDNCRQILYV
ncbi:histone-lysine N-methyltransferase SUV39H2-like protein [Leptotrombidium deliense]|uniref:Histone-lysine N-methyltransferase SUV39H2-like protein n=1 Tax=Leptotrombidium deliense TaxID=299467 RepID=A0A443STZ5_9ACAR|nr:histone-lysine N-methyltransferase SUV39H2-like protein [Leptotrombidium deliense]